MPRLIEISFFAATILSPVCAQNAPPTPLPPAMQSAIDRLAKGDGVGKNSVVFQNAPPVETCSVPLLELQVDHPERFTVRTVPPAAIDRRMPRTQGPAPVCGQTARPAPAEPPAR